jgi:hypothetical protein
LYMYGAHQETITQCEKILELLNSGKNEASHFPVFEVYYYLATAYAALGNMDSAISMYRRVIPLRKDNRYKASMMNNVGMIWKSMGELDSTMAYYQSALDLVRKYPDSVKYGLLEGSILNNIATSYEDHGEFDKTIPIYEKNILRYENAIKVYRFKKMFRFINAGISLMNAELEMRNYPRVKILYEQFSPLIDTLTYYNHQTNDLYMYKVCSRYFSEIGDFKKAYTNQLKAAQLSDSVTLKDNLVKGETKKQLVLLENRQFEHQLQEQMLEHEHEKQLARSRLWLIILMTLGAILTPISFYYYYKQRLRLQVDRAKLHITSRLLAEEKLKTNEQEKHLVEINLENKRKDLADMAISLFQKKEWATELNQHLLIIESSKGNKRSRELIKLKDNVRSQIYVNKQTDLLRENIDALSAEYYKKLREEFPSLTKTEMKLCSFIRLKLTIPQIADLQNIDTASVVVGRYRLKKKLGLDTNQNLDEFLQTF